MTVPSFLFIVNDLTTNDDPDQPGSIPQRRINGRWHPPEVPQGFYAQQPGDVYRWSNGAVTLAGGYYWTAQSTENANGTIYTNGSNGGFIWPQYYRAATVFFCNRFDLFFTAVGDAGTRVMADCGPEETWQPLTFLHENNNSYVQHAGDEEHLAVRQAAWLEQLLPNAYRRESRSGPSTGGLSGLLPIIIALVAFSCATEDFYRILIDERAWRGHRWVPHSRPHGRM